MQRSPGKNTIAVIGDSHANHLYLGLTTVANDHEGIAVFPSGGEIPLIELESGGDLNNEVFKIHAYLVKEGFDYILSHKEMSKVVLSHYPVASWHMLADRLNPDNHDLRSMMHDGFARTYDTLTKAGKEIYVMLDNPDYPAEKWQSCYAAWSTGRRPLLHVLDFLNPHDKLADCSIETTQSPGKQALDNWTEIARVEVV